MRNYGKAITSAVFLALYCFTATHVFGAVSTSFGQLGTGIRAQLAAPPENIKVVLAITVAGSKVSPLALPSPVLGSGQTGVAYAATLNASGGTAPYTWGLRSGSLPAGLVLQPTGQITGVPTGSGTSSFTVMVKDSGNPVQGQSTSASLTVLGPKSTPLTIASSALPSGQVGAAYSASVQASGGIPGYSWSIQSGSLPAGLSLASNGQVSGTPIATGTSTFTMAVSDAGNPAQTQAATATISVAGPKSSPLAITSTSLSSGQNGTAYAASLQATGGTPAYTWSISSGTLPPGLSLAATTGVISGTPTTNGTFNFTARVADNSSPGQSQSGGMSITVGAAAATSTGPGTTWYVRPDGGTRYSSNITQGQCDGKADVPYSGTGVNQHCAFKDVRFLWSDGSYTTGDRLPGWGWIGSGGDTYIVRGSIADGVWYRVGWNSSNSYCDNGGCWGITGAPSGSGAPTPPSGTAAQHTRILGGNWNNATGCSSQNDRTQLRGGFQAGGVLSFSGTSYVDLQCFDITDNDACGGARSPCSTTNDYSYNGLQFNNQTTHFTGSQIRVHGMARFGIYGPTGDGTVLDHIDLLGNAGGGWNSDISDGTTGVGSLQVSNFNISWNGCEEEFPAVHPLPYTNCTDDSDGGYGDGWGTATVPSNPPGWQVHFDQGVASYNTQDGLDALHLVGNGSSITITRTLAYGNMGQQLKAGGAAGSIMNSQIVGNCFAMSGAIPGAPTGYNTGLSDFCRAGNDPILMSTGKGGVAKFINNTILSSGASAMVVQCDTSAGLCDNTTQLNFQNNIFIGYANTAANGNPYNGNSGPQPSWIYLCIANSDCSAIQALNMDPFMNAGSINSHNLVVNSKEGCPRADETNAYCGDPGLVDETFHLYGYGNMAPTATSIVHGAGAVVPSVTVDYFGKPRNKPPTLGAIE